MRTFTLSASVMKGYTSKIRIIHEDWPVSVLSS
jgi:hypothetical protein